MRAYYSAQVSDFIRTSEQAILGALTERSEFDVTGEQRDAWLTEIRLLKTSLGAFSRGSIFFEFVVPRLGRRIDVLVVVDHLILILEFKVGETVFTRAARDQVWDYALDLKNFHETSHKALIVPLLVATRGPGGEYTPSFRQYRDGVFYPEHVSAGNIARIVADLLSRTSGEVIAQETWESGSYRPTPTIIEAAKSLYARHSIKELARSDAGAKNLARTSGALSEIIQRSRDLGRKAICLVTGVPGAGKTLVGLDVATRHMDVSSELHSVYLSGNGPLVAILREALTRDRVAREQEAGRRMRKGEARQDVEAFIQNVHHFRDECVKDPKPPVEHVAIFDEAQRAWNLEQTTSFMARKKNTPGFKMSEPEFLISCLDRHSDWAVIVCLIGNGQEINTGEAGMGEWMGALARSYPDWEVYVSDRFRNEDNERPDAAVGAIHLPEKCHYLEDLHLSVSMRSFRAENVSDFVQKVLDLDAAGASRAFGQLADKYPIRITRCLQAAKRWLREQARGSERYGIVVSSQAQRLKPLAIDVRVSTEPVHWFLDGPDDVRSSFYLEDVATEFDVQGLELDWTCLVWDADLRYVDGSWQHQSFAGSRWNAIRSSDRKIYQKNAYRVLLTRARQGMIVVIPEGDAHDPTRAPAYYDGTYRYLASIGIPELPYAAAAASNCRPQAR